MKELPAPPQLHELIGKHITEQKRPPFTLTQHSSGFPAFLIGFGIGAFLIGYGLYTLLALEKAEGNLLKMQIQKLNDRTLNTSFPTPIEDSLDVLQKELNDLIRPTHPQS